MKVRRSIVAAGAVVVLGGAGATLPAVASASSATHTLKFISVTKKVVFFNKARTQIGMQDTDVNAAGNTVGFDMIYVRVISPTNGPANATVDTSGGMLYGTFTFNLKAGTISNGKVTGGTGAFKGATGTITAKGISKTKAAVTIVYS
jgi:hypothetical protein